ncbi:MAG: hypothetical protein H0T51_01310 [Pirellulales bacterium]|nr:hypothetical protein [Pirellulales bacterium]
MTTLVIDGGSGTSFPVLQVLAEFSLSGIPAGADVLSAQLKLDATSTSSSSLTINAAGYSGDGLASLSDEFTSTTPLGSKTGPFTIAGDVTINLNADFIDSLLGDASHLGLRLSSATVGPYVNIASLESTGVAPTLVIQYATTQPGDFDLDADVDVDDFLSWSGSAVWAPTTTPAISTIGRPTSARRRENWRQLRRRRRSRLRRCWRRSRYFPAGSLPRADLLAMLLSTDAPKLR